MAEVLVRPLAPKIVWPEGKKFAFTIFDDTDMETVENAGAAYALLAECGLRTDEVVLGGPGRSQPGLRHRANGRGRRLFEVAAGVAVAGFRVGWHGATWHSVPRKMTAAALERFAELFGHYPGTAANHATVDEAIYWVPTG